MTVVIVLAVLIPALAGAAFGVYWLVKNAGSGGSEKRLVGRWEHVISERPLRKVELDVRADHALTMTISRDAAAIATPITWEVAKSSGDSLTIRVTYPPNYANGPPGGKDEWTFKFNGDSQVTAVLGGSSPPRAFKRK